MQNICNPDVLLHCFNSFKVYWFLFDLEAQTFVVAFPFQVGSNGMLDDWEENLAVITANRTKGDELVIIHLGDCLWKERSEVQLSIFYLFSLMTFVLFHSASHLRLLF